VTPNPKVKKRGSNTDSASKVKKNAHAGSIQNVNNTREALKEEGSDQQVIKNINNDIIMTWQ
jgi:hypothetical protein